MSPSVPLPDPKCCPLCGRFNACAMEEERRTGRSQPPCWCTQAEFPPQLLARIPAERQRLACVCADCARAAVSSPGP